MEHINIRFTTAGGAGGDSYISGTNIKVTGGSGGPTGNGFGQLAYGGTFIPIPGLLHVDGKEGGATVYGASYGSGSGGAGAGYGATKGGDPTANIRTPPGTGGFAGRANSYPPVSTYFYGTGGNGGYANDLSSNSFTLPVAGSGYGAGGGGGAANENYACAGAAGAPGLAAYLFI